MIMETRFSESAQAYIHFLREALVEEVVKVFGTPRRSLIGRSIAAAVRPAARHLAELAAQFEERVGMNGLPDASRWLLPRFVRSVDVQGTESVPTEGPLLVTANHPGSVDGLIIAAQLPRPDLKIVIADLPFFLNLRILKERLIYVSRDTYQRLTSVRAAIRHLRDGGAVLIFPGGTIEPDPAVLPGMQAAIDSWSESIDLILRRVPDTKVLVGIVSGVLSPSLLRSPLTRFRRNLKDRQRIAEIIQTINQLLLPFKPSVHPHLRFSNPFTLEEIQRRYSESSAIEAVRRAARSLLDSNQNSG
jgi:hypothetical protein